MKILIVDDSLIVRNLVSTWLTEVGYEVVSSEGPADFIRQAVTEQPDLVLMDIDMPGYPGNKLTNLVTRERFAKCPVILHSSRSGEELARLCLQCGAADYIEKTHDRALFVEKVSSFLAKRKTP